MPPVTSSSGKRFGSLVTRKPSSNRKKVIVELVWPEESLQLAMNRSRAPIKSSPGNRKITPQQDIWQTQEMDVLEKELRTIVSAYGAKKLKRLPAAHAFVVEASPEEITQISELKNVSAVRLNRVHRAI